MSYELRGSKKYMGNFYYGDFTINMLVTDRVCWTFTGLKLYCNTRLFFPDFIDIEFCVIPWMFPTVNPRHIPSIIKKFIASNQWLLYINCIGIQRVTV